MPADSRRRWVSAPAGLVLVVATWIAPPPVLADPEVTPPPAGPTLSLPDLGSTAPLAFYGAQGTAELTFPVPPGMVPAALRATVEMPVNVRSGTLSVVQRDRTVVRVALPAQNAGGEQDEPGEQTVDIPLAGVRVEDNSVTVTMRTYLVPEQGYCLDPTNPLRLTAAAVSFSGAEAPPGSVADFLPPVLRKLTIAVPATPSQAESDAAVGLAAAVTAHYGQQPTAVSVTSLGTPLPGPAPFERTVIIRAGEEAGLRLQPVAAQPRAVPNLQISGSDNELENQVRFLTSDIARLAVSSKAVAGPLKSRPQLAGDVTTLRDLGQPVVSAVALAPQVSLGLDQTKIGRPVKSVRVRLIGSYTPPPNSVSARLVAIVGGETIATWPVDPAGVIDRWVDVPDRLLQRYTTLGVVLNVAGNTGRCGEFQPLTLTIDGDSVVQSSAAMPPVPAGLQSLPQSLMPRMLIGIGPDAFTDTVRAAAIAVAMQRLSVLPIDTEVTTVEQALRSPAPAVVIAADGWTDSAVRLPVSADGGRITLDGVADQGQSTTVTLDPELKFASMQAFYDGRRSLLVATSNAAPDRLDDLLRWMTADPRRFSTLDGVAVIAAPGRQPIVVGAQSGVVGSTAAPGRNPLWWAAAGAGLAAALGAGWLMVRRRSRT